MDSKLRAGVIGIGIMGAAHARQLAGNPHTTLVAVADHLAERAERLATELGAEAYQDYQAMLGEERLDVVVVATPDPFHRQPIEAAAQAAVPTIITEKPMATTVEDSEAIMEAVRSSGSRIITNYSNRTSPLDIAAHYVIQNGLLGQVTYGDVRVEDNISVPSSMWGTRSREWAAGSSSAHFLLSHVSDLMRWHFAPAEVTGVYAISQARILGYTPDVYDGYLYFDNGLKVRVKADWAKEMDELVTFDLTFTGSEGSLIYTKLAGFGGSAGLRANVSASLSLDDLARCQETLRQKGLRSRLIRRTSRPDVGDSFKPGLELYPTDQKQGWKNLLDYAIEAVVEDKDVPASWEGNGSLPWGDEGLKATRIVCAIMESARQAKEIAVR